MAEALLSAADGAEALMWLAGPTALEVAPQWPHSPSLFSIYYCNTFDLGNALIQTSVFLLSFLSAVIWGRAVVFCVHEGGKHLTEGLPGGNLYLVEVSWTLFFFPTAASWKKCNSFKLVFKRADKKSAFSLLAYMSFYCINLTF